MGKFKEAVNDHTDILFGIAMFVIICLVNWNYNTKPHKEMVKSETKTVLDDAHKKALLAVDTMDFIKQKIDVKAATKDSAFFARKMHHIINAIYTDNDSLKNTHIDINKEMQNYGFAENYKQYQNAIQKLEIARRQQKIR